MTTLVPIFVRGDITSALFNPFNNTNNNNNNSNNNNNNSNNTASLQTLHHCATPYTQISVPLIVNGGHCQDFFLSTPKNIFGTIPLTYQDMGKYITERRHIPDHRISVTDPLLPNVPSGPIDIGMKTKLSNKRPVSNALSQYNSIVIDPFTTSTPDPRYHFHQHSSFIPLISNNPVNLHTNPNNVTHIIVLQNHDKPKDNHIVSMADHSRNNNLNLSPTVSVFSVPKKHSIENKVISNETVSSEIKEEKSISNINFQSKIENKDPQKLEPQRQEDRSNAVLAPSTIVESMKSTTKEKKRFDPTGHEITDHNGLSSKSSENRTTVTGKRKYKCKECDKVFNNRHNLSHHMRYHRNDRRFKCVDCDKSFFQKIHLVEHKRIHTGEKPHECSICTRRFRHSTNLKRHVKSIHLNEQFQCRYCSQSFKRKATLKQHITRVHEATQHQ